MKRSNPYLNNGIFKLSEFPTELMITILNRLSVNDAIALLQTSEEMKKYIINDEIWKGYGSKNFEDFVIRVQKLPEKYKLLVIKNNYSLLLAEEIVRLLSLPTYQRMETLLTTKEIKSLFSKHKFQFLTFIEKETGVVMLCEKLISLEQVARLSTNHINGLLSKNEGITALRKNLFTLEEFAEIPKKDVVSFIHEKLKQLHMDIENEKPGYTRKF